MWRAISLEKKPWCWERLQAGGEGTTEDEMVGWHHQRNEHEFEKNLRESEGQKSLPCCHPWGCKESDTISHSTTTTTHTHKHTHSPEFKGQKLAAAAAAKSLQSCPTLCNPRDGSPPGSPIPGILQARTLEWAAISFSSASKWKVKVKLLSCVWLLATPWTAAHQALPSMGFSRQEYWSGVPLPSPYLPPNEQ